MKTIICREAGFDCSYVAKGENDEEVMQKGTEHVMKEHGVKLDSVTPEFKEKVKALIHTT